MRALLATVSDTCGLKTVATTVGRPTRKRRKTDPFPGAGPSATLDAPPQNQQPKRSPMRSLILLLGLMLAACGDDTDSTQQPDLVQRPGVVRDCGELDGVDPVDPVVVGQSSIEHRGETRSCPMFAPVPCTRPLWDYRAICGEGCLPQTAVTPGGDTWLTGCVLDTPGMPCNLNDTEPAVVCLRDPYVGNPYWFWFYGCGSPFIELACWSVCDAEAPPDPPEWCP